MARLLPPLWTVLDVNGNPVPGAQVFFFNLSSSTKKTTFSDASLSTKNTNPVICDASGRIGDVFGASESDYKVVVAPANDTDPPTSPIETFETLIGPAASGDIVSVKKFGAIGDGTTLDTVAIQAAVDSVEAVYFPPGTYLIDNSTTPIVVPAGRTLWGPGTVKGNSPGRSLFECIGTESLLLKDTKFDGLGFEADSSIKDSRESFTATASQTLFTLTSITYGAADATDLHVFVNGVKQVITTDYTETTDSSFTFVTPLSGGETVLAVITTSGDAANGAVRFAYVDNFTITNCHCKNIILAVGTVDSETVNLNFTKGIGRPLDGLAWDTLTDANMSRNVTITHNTGFDGSTYDRSTEVTGNVHFCWIFGIRNFDISNNEFKGYKAGGVVVGGLVNNSSGAANNATAGFELDVDANLKAHTGTISNNTVDTTNVGLWTWGARDILFEGNTVKSVKAESHDVEASVRITFRGGKLLNVRGQCLFTFYDNRDIIFENMDCNIEMNDSTGDVFLQDLQDLDPSTSKYNSVIIRNCKFKAVGATGTRSVATVQVLAIEEFVFTDNKCTDVAVFDNGDHTRLVYERNEMINTGALLHPVKTITAVFDFSNPISTVAGDRINLVSVHSNKFIARGTAINDVSAIETGWSNKNMTYEINNNIVVGHQRLFNMPSASAAALGASSSLNIIKTKNNSIDFTAEPALIQDDTTVLTDTNMLHLWENNVGADGYDVYGLKPNTAPFNMYFSKGSTVAEATGGVGGFICTTSGHKTASKWQDTGVKFSEYNVTFTAGTGTVTISGGVDTLAVIKKGREVTVYGATNIASVSGPSGTLTMPLPFTASSLTERAVRTGCYIYGKGMTRLAVELRGTIAAGSTVLTLSENDGAGGDKTAVADLCQTNTEFRFWFSFITDE